MHRLIIDTDIGSDVDDAMVLSAVSAFSNLELRGVTCVYGDVELRGKIALSYLGGLAPVYIGESQPISGVEPWHSGLEGSSLGDLSGFQPRDGAIEFLNSQVERFPGEIEILAIGPLTNIARVIEKNPSWVEKVKALYVMGGDFARDFVEHNFKSDVRAAQIVFGSGIRVSVMPLDVTREVAIDISDFDFLGDSALGREIRQWASYKSLAFNNPHDLMALLLIFQPELFSLSEWGSVEVSDEGRSVHRVDKAGKQRVVMAVDKAAVRERVLEVLAR